MTITTDDVIAVFSKVFQQDIDIDHDVPILEAGLRLESLRMMGVLVGLQDLVGGALPEEDAFELFGLSINELVRRLNDAPAPAGA